MRIRRFARTPAVDSIRRRVAAAAALLLVSPRGFAAGAIDAAQERKLRLARPPAWAVALDESARSKRPVVAFFTLPGCPHCLRARAESLRHLAAQAAERGVQVYEIDITDTEPLAGPGSETPAALARRLDVRRAPTVAFYGPQGEIAERLVGYAPDFYEASLNRRIETARSALGAG